MQSVGLQRTSPVIMLALLADVSATHIASESVEMCSKSATFVATHDAERSSQSRSTRSRRCQERTAAQTRGAAAQKLSTCH